MSHQSSGSVLLIKYLGVILSKDLSWAEHINSVHLDANIGWVFCIGHFILRVPHASPNFLFSQSSTTVPASGTLIQYSTQTTWICTGFCYKSHHRAMAPSARWWPETPKLALTVHSLQETETFPLLQNCDRLIHYLVISCHNHHLPLCITQNKSSTSSSLMPLWNSLPHDLVSSSLQL